MRSFHRVTGLIALAPFVFAGCFRSHLAGSDDGPTDGAPRDLGRPDLGPRDLGHRDGAAPDLGGEPAGCRALTIFDRDDAPLGEWISECGPFDSVALVGRGERFDQVVRESGAECERPPQLVARSVRIEADRLTYGRVTPLVDVAPRSRGLAAAAGDGDLFVATGTEWTAFTGEYTRGESGSLAPPPAPAPGCLLRLDATALVRRPGGWAATFDYFECDVGGAKYRFYETDRLTPVTEPETVWQGIGDAAPWNEGLFFIGAPRRDSDTPVSWVAGPGAVPRTATLDTSGDHAAVARFPADELVVALARRPEEDAGTLLSLLVIDEAGEVLHRSDTHLTEVFGLAGFQPIVLDVAATDFGGVVSVGVRRTGSGSALVAAGFDRSANLLEGALVERYGSPALLVPVEGRRNRAVVSVLQPDRDLTIETFLVGCDP